MIVNLISKRYYCVARVTSRTIVQQESLLTKILKKITPSSSETRSPQEILHDKYIAIGVPLLYNSCANTFDYIKFVERYNVPDTVDGWYRLTYLHMWMVLVRVSKENKDLYDDFREDLVMLLWKDCTERIKKLKMMPKVSFSTNKVVHNWLSDFYYELFFGVQEYDEALMSGDTVLAGALWRNVYDKSDEYDVVVLNNFVKYVRMHIHLLHKMDLDTLMTKGIKWQFVDS